MSCWPDFHKISSIFSRNIFANPDIFILTEFLFLLKILMLSTNFPAIPRISFHCHSLINLYVFYLSCHLAQRRAEALHFTSLSRNM